MSSLPLAVRTALWATSAWQSTQGAPDLAQALAQAHPDVDHVGGDLSRLELWHDLGERALLVALPRPGHVAGVPRTGADALGAAAAAGECVFVAGVGGLLVPEIGTFGPAGDEGTQVTWTAYDAEPVARHTLESIDLGDLERSLTATVGEEVEALESVGGRPWSNAPRDSADDRLRRGRWGLPDGLPTRAARLLTIAARVAVIADEGLALAAAGPTLDLHSSSRREQGLRRLGVAADAALAGATNVSVMAMAGWRPA